MRHRIIIYVALSILLSTRSFAFVIPKDLPTIEALIALHKAVKKDEDQALKRVATSFGEQSLVAKGAYPRYQVGQCPFVPCIGRSHIKHRQLALSVNQRV